MTIQVKEVTTLTKTECGKCGIVFAMPESLRLECKKTGQGWYCPNGHGRAYTESEAQRLQKQLDRERRSREAYESSSNEYQRQRDAARRSAAAQRGQNTKLRKRAAAGVCPCCSRHFEKLQSHMETKHPEFVEETRV